MELPISHRSIRDVRTDVPKNFRQQWYEVEANGRMQFKVGNFKSSDERIRMFTCTHKARLDSLLTQMNNPWTTGLQRSCFAHSVT